MDMCPRFHGLVICLSLLLLVPHVDLRHLGVTDEYISEIVSVKLLNPSLALLGNSQNEVFPKILSVQLLFTEKPKVTFNLTRRYTDVGGTRLLYDHGLYSGDYFAEYTGDNVSTLLVRCLGSDGSCILSGCLWMVKTFYLIKPEIPLPGLNPHRLYKVPKYYQNGTFLGQVVLSVWENLDLSSLSLVPGAVHYQRDATEGNREPTSGHVIEVMLMPDWSLYQFFQGELVDHPDPRAALKTHLQTIIIEIGHLFKTIYGKSENMKINIKISSILFCTSKIECLWSDSDGQENLLDGQKALKDLHNWITLIRGLVSFHEPDYTIALTRKHLVVNGQPTSDNYLVSSGKMCSDNLADRTCIIQDGNNVELAAARCLAQGMGVPYDFDTTACRHQDQYIMSKSLVLQRDKQSWEFSTCSVESMETFIKRLNIDGNNCLLDGADAKHLKKKDLRKLTTNIETISLEAHCRLTFGKASYPCNKGRKMDLCAIGLPCFNPKTDLCEYVPNKTGPVCDENHDKVCYKGKCVYPVVVHKKRKRRSTISRTNAREKSKSSLSEATTTPTTTSFQNSTKSTEARSKGKNPSDNQPSSKRNAYIKIGNPDLENLDLVTINVLCKCLSEMGSTCSNTESSKTKLKVEDMDADSECLEMIIRGSTCQTDAEFARNCRTYCLQDTKLTSQENEGELVSIENLDTVSLCSCLIKSGLNCGNSITFKTICHIECSLDLNSVSNPISESDFHLEAVDVARFSAPFKQIGESGDSAIAHPAYTDVPFNAFTFSTSGTSPKEFITLNEARFGFSTVFPRTDSSASTVGLSSVTEVHTSSLATQDGSMDTKFPSTQTEEMDTTTSNPGLSLPTDRPTMSSVSTVKASIHSSSEVPSSVLFSSSLSTSTLGTGSTDRSTQTASSEVPTKEPPTASMPTHSGTTDHPTAESHTPTSRIGTTEQATRKVPTRPDKNGTTDAATNRHEGTTDLSTSRSQTQGSTDMTTPQGPKFTPDKITPGRTDRKITTEEATTTVFPFPDFSSSVQQSSSTTTTSPQTTPPYVTPLFSRRQFSSTVSGLANTARKDTIPTSTDGNFVSEEPQTLKPVNMYSGATEETSQWPPGNNEF